MRLVAVIVQKHVFFLRAKFTFKWPRVHEEHITFLGKSGSLIKVAHMKGALRGSEYHDIAKIIKQTAKSQEKSTQHQYHRIYCYSS